MEKILSLFGNFPTEVFGWKCLKFGLFEFLSLLNSLFLRKRSIFNYRLQEHRCEMLGFSTKNTRGIKMYEAKCIVVCLPIFMLEFMFRSWEMIVTVWNSFARILSMHKCSLVSFPTCIMKSFITIIAFGTGIRLFTIKAVVFFTGFENLDGISLQKSLNTFIF